MPDTPFPYHDVSDLTDTAYIQQLGIVFGRHQSPAAPFPIYFVFPNTPDEYTRAPLSIKEAEVVVKLLNVLIAKAKADRANAKTA